MSWDDRYGNWKRDALPDETSTEVDEQDNAPFAQGYAQDGVMIEGGEMEAPPPVKRDPLPERVMPGRAEDAEDLGILDDLAALRPLLDRAILPGQDLSLAQAAYWLGVMDGQKANGLLDWMIDIGGFDLEAKAAGSSRPPKPYAAAVAEIVQWDWAAIAENGKRLSGADIRTPIWMATLNDIAKRYGFDVEIEPDTSDIIITRKAK